MPVSVIHSTVFQRMHEKNSLFHFSLSFILKAHSMRIGSIIAALSLSLRLDASTTPGVSSDQTHATRPLLLECTNSEKEELLCP